MLICNKKEKVTVGQMIETLMAYDPKSEIEVAVCQINKRHPVAYCSPEKHDNNKFAIVRDGVHVRIEITLPNNEEEMMVTQTRKQ